MELKGLMTREIIQRSSAGQIIICYFVHKMVLLVYDFRKKQSFLFDHSNGLSSPENKAFLYSNGYVIISHSGRFEYFKLSDLDNYSSTVTPYLNTIVADTIAVFTRTGLEKEQNIKLLHNQNTLSFSFSAPEFLLS